MSPGPFPDRVDASKLFARNGRIAANLPISRLTRLTSSLANTEGQIDVVLQFGMDAEGNKLLTGSVTGVLQLVCQRCFDVMTYAVDAELSLRVFATRTELDKHLELFGQDVLDDDVLVLDELAESDGKADDADKKPASGTTQSPSSQELDVLALVEDELLLNLPLSARHEDAGCNKDLLHYQQQSEAVEKAVRDKVVNPFAALAQLKDRS
jgi:uncharacterized protein